MTSPSKVLVVEDDLSLRPFWSMTIRRAMQGSEIDWAVSAEEALRMLRLNPPYALVITDIFLAGAGTGVDVLRSHLIDPRKTKRLLVSAANEKEIRGQISIEDAVILTKPLNLPKCERAIGEAMG